MKRPTAANYGLWHCLRCGAVNADALSDCPKCYHVRRTAKSPDVDGLARVSSAGAGQEPHDAATARHGAANATRESVLQGKCGEWLTLHGVTYLHLSPKAREHKGWPDLTFALHGVPCAVELKSATGKLSQDQADCLYDLQRNGWRVGIIRELQDFIEWCEKQTTQEREG